MKSNHYDIVILGGGCAGMQLMYQLIHHTKYKEESILIVDPNKAYLESKSWCFWHKEKTHPYQSIFHASWNNLSIGLPTTTQLRSIYPYRYSYIKSEAFFDFHFHLINQYPNIEYANEDVRLIDKKEDHFVIKTSDRNIITATLYSSFWNPQRVIREANIFLKQQFFGWEIDVEEPVFNASSATLMDFNVRQSGGVNFAYVLPYNKHRALIEITGFSSDDYSKDFFEEELKNYIQQKWNCTYTIIKTEHASIPMTNFVFNRFTKDGAIAIGTAAGMVKSTTGYAFNRITRDSVELANHYFKNEKPAQFNHTRFKFYDRLLLQLIQNAPTKALHILMQLFHMLPYQDILLFLDEDSSLFQEAALFSKLPKKDFIKQIFTNGNSK